MTFIPVRKIDDREERFIIEADEPKNVMSAINASATRRGYIMHQGLSFTDLILDCISRANMYSKETDKSFVLASLMLKAKETLEDEFKLTDPIFTLEEWKT